MFYVILSHESIFNKYSGYIKAIKGISITTSEENANKKVKELKEENSKYTFEIIKLKELDYLNVLTGKIKENPTLQSQLVNTVSDDSDDDSTSDEEEDLPPMKPINHINLSKYQPTHKVADESDDLLSEDTLSSSEEDTPPKKPIKRVLKKSVPKK